MDYIDIKRLTVFANHGVFPAETVLGQKFLVSCRLHHVTSHAGMCDDLSRGIDYGVVCTDIVNFLQNNTFKLIETCAEKLARHLLLEYDALHQVDLTIEKPWAPVHEPLESISVTVHRGWHPVLIALGSNEGNRLENLCNAIDTIEDLAGVRLKKISSFIETPAVGRTNENPYLNAAIRIDTVLLPRELLKKLQTVEKQFGRIKTTKWSARPLDLDIIFYDDIISNRPALYLPHPRYRERLFVLEPLVEIEPYFRDPQSSQTVLEHYNHLSKKIIK